MAAMPYDVRSSPTSQVLAPDTLIVYLSDGVYVYETLIQYIQDNASVTLAALTAVIADLPTSLPATSGVLWLNGGVVQLS